MFKGEVTQPSPNLIFERKNIHARLFSIYLVQTEQRKTKINPFFMMFFEFSLLLLFIPPFTYVKKPIR